MAALVGEEHWESVLTERDAEQRKIITREFAEQGLEQRRRALEEARRQAQQASLVDEVFKRNDAALSMDDEELDDEARGMKATLLLLFDGKLEPWPHQVKAVLRLEKERLMLLNKKKEDGIQKLLRPTVLAKHCLGTTGA